MVGNGEAEIAVKNAQAGMRGFRGISMGTDFSQEVFSDFLKSGCFSEGLPGFPGT